MTKPKSPDSGMKVTGGLREAPTSPAKPVQLEYESWQDQVERGVEQDGQPGVFLGFIGFLIGVIACCIGIGGALVPILFALSHRRLSASQAEAAPWDCSYEWLYFYFSAGC